jgi:nucleoid-associated protein YgaU
MFVKSHIWVLAIAVLIAVFALSTARPSAGASGELRHVVQPGETLWTIAASRYAGDPRKAIWRIEERNGVDGAALQPGTVLYLPQ